MCEVQLNVIFTTRGCAVAALEAAAELSSALNTEIQLIVPQVIPYPLPLGRPAVPVTFMAPWLHALAARVPGRIRIQVFLCRDRRRALLEFLKPGSWVVIGAQRRWWLHGEERLARWLRAKGYRVITVLQTKEENSRKVS